MKVEKTQRRHAEQILKAALEASDPAGAIKAHLRGKLLRGLEGSSNLYVVGAGKASARMAEALEKAVGDRITRGLINTKYGHLAKLRRIELNECGHPVPDDAGQRGAERILDLANRAGQGDVVICLVSGGASALLPLPASGITLEDKQRTTRMLLECGADIHEINTVRKHISGIKGGQLAAAAHPASVVALILSDVIGDDLDVIGSGVTAPDRSTYADARAVLERFQIWNAAPAAVRQRIEAGCAGSVPETPKPDHQAFRGTKNIIVGSNRVALEAAKAKAKRLGYKTVILSSVVDGETREIARMHAAIAREVMSTGQPVKPPACILSGGETTVTIRGNGKGGRNQEFVLATALALDTTDGVTVLSAGTDGTDGPTDAAGAVANGSTLQRAQQAGLNVRAHLDSNDAYPLFDNLGDLVRTGPTGTNVMDVRILLAGVP